MAPFVSYVKKFKIRNCRKVSKNKYNRNDLTIFNRKKKKIKGSNFVGHKGIFEIKKNNQKIGKLYPEKRLFIVQEIGMSETAIFTNFFYDIYIAITSPLNDSKTWAVRIYYKPCVKFIWFGGILIFLSSILSLLFFIKKNL